MTMTGTRPAGIGRRLAALVYDSMLLVAVLFLGTLVLLPLTGGEAITPQDSGPWEHLYRIWIATLAIGFFGVSWTRRGQTLGMMSWKIRLVRDSGHPLRWHDVGLRLVTGTVVAVLAIAGAWQLARPGGMAGRGWALTLLLPLVANYAWMAFDPLSRTLQDRLTRCRVLRTG